MRLTQLVTTAVFLISLSLIGCGDEEEPSTTSDATEPADASDSSDPADSSDPSDTSEPADTSDPSDETDPTEPPAPEGTNCGDYLICVDDCWTTDSADVETCLDECDAAAAPGALAAADAYYECLDDCDATTESDEDWEICFEQECTPLYNACIAPPACIQACDHYDEICGDDGPLDTQRTYLAGGNRYVIEQNLQEVVIALHASANSTPDLPGVDRLESHRTLDSKNMLVAHFDSKTISPNAFDHPAVRNTYPVFRNNLGARLLSTDEVLFHAPTQSAEQIEVTLQELKMILVRPAKGLPHTWLARSQFEDSVSASDRLLSAPGVKWASPNFLRHYELKHVPNDPFFENQWHHLNDGETPRSLAGADMRTTLAWDITKGNPEVTIAINDDGVDLRHDDIPFLRNSEMEIQGVNIPSSIDDDLAQGCCQHGTSVAGVSAAIADNEIGTVGVCPGCSIIPVWTDFSAPNEDLAVAETFTQSTQLGAWAINNSWGPPDGNPAVLETPVPFDPVADIIDQAFVDAAENGREGKGTVVVFAAGNGNEDVTSDAFASHPLTIAVASVNARGIKSSYSDFGDAVWVAAPSNGNHLMPGIVTSDVLGDLGYALGDNPDDLDPSGDVTSDFGGTSSAAPALTGLIGLMFSANPELTAQQAKDILRRTSRKIDKVHGQYEEDEDGFLRSPFYGYGLIDAHAAVRAAHIGCEPEQTDLCIPASTCNDGPLPLVPESCNGIDDNCDGTVDEDVCPAPVDSGETCDLTGGCHDDCTWLENDPVPYCPAACDDGCLEDQVCSGGFCIPDSGRHSAALDEVCDGFDNNLDGNTDEDACEPSTDATCEYTAQCDDSNGPIMCVEGFCAPVCETNDDCDAGVECQEVASQYGTGTDTSICAPSLDTGLTCIDACIFLNENAPAAIFQSITNCITEAATCDDAIACVPL